MLAKIACQACARYFMTDHAEEMMSAITGSCPRCGGAFAVETPADLAGEPVSVTKAA